MVPGSMEEHITQEEQALADDKMRAEIAKLIAETHQIDDKMRAEIAKLIAETHQIDDKMRAEIAKLIAETRQNGVSTFLAPTLAAAALMGAGAAIVKLFF
jgi:septal ring factor EnvC (AmiA/AmiB activator)